MAITRSDFLGPLAVAAFSACGVETVPTYAVRDSAGIQIVENRTAAWRTGEEWTVDTNPVVDIGGPNADSAYALFQVMHAARLRDGRIAVVNTSSNDIRIFDARGAHLTTIGRRGDGPGEFAGVWWLAELPGDSLLVLDIGRGFHFNVFTADGRFARRFTTPVSRSVEDVAMIGRFADGSMLIYDQNGESRPSGAMTRHHVPLYRIGAGGEPLDTLGFVPGQTGAIGNTRYIWGPWGHQAVADSTFFVGSASSFEVEHRSLDGKILRLIRLERPGRSTTSKDVEDYLSGVYSRAGRSRAPNIAAIRQRLAGATFAQTLPPYFDLLADAGGKLWVQEYAMEIGTGTRWSIFDTAGVFLGDLQLPERFRVFEIGTDYILGNWRDDTDTERVRMLRLTKANR